MSAAATVIKYPLSNLTVDLVVIRAVACRVEIMDKFRIDGSPVIARTVT